MKIFEEIDTKDIYNLKVKEIKQYDHFIFVVCDEEPKRDHMGQSADTIEDVVFFIGDNSRISVPNIGDTIKVYGKENKLLMVEKLYTRKNGTQCTVIKYNLSIKDVMPVDVAQTVIDERTEKNRHVLDGKVLNVKFAVTRKGTNKFGKMYAILVDDYDIRYYHPYTTADESKNIDKGDDVYLDGFVSNNGKIPVAVGKLSNAPKGTDIIENRIDINDR